MKDKIIEILEKVVANAFAFENYDGPKSSQDFTKSMESFAEEIIATRIASLSSGVSDMPPIGQACNSFYDWVEHMELPEHQKPIALKGWTACFRWMQKLSHPTPASEPAQISEREIEEVVKEFKSEFTGYPHENHWNHEVRGAALKVAVTPTHVIDWFKAAIKHLKQ